MCSKNGLIEKGHLDILMPARDAVFQFVQKNYKTDRFNMHPDLTIDGYMEKLADDGIAYISMHESPQGKFMQFDRSLEFIGG
jgi:hypothetical protein